MTPSFESKDLSLEACSHHCSDIAGDDCQVFEFCEKIRGNVMRRTCRMSSTREAVEYNVKDEDCALYLKSPPAPTVTRTAFSPSLTASMSILLLVIGAVCGGAIYHFKFASNS